MLSAINVLLSGVIFLLLVIALIFSAAWLKLLLALALILFVIIFYASVHAGKERDKAIPATPQPAARTEPSPILPSPEEVQQHINDEKLAAISKFCSVMAHELRNPLASLKNIAYYFSKTLKTDDERINKMVAMMASEVDRTNMMISDMTEVSHLKRINKTPSDISELVTSALISVTVDNAIQIVPDIEKVVANADPDKFRTFLRNLVTNAADSMPNGGLIEITLKKRDTSYDLTVKDNGSGMDATTLSHIFEPMFTTKTKVLGLGLTIVREIVRIHGGTISIASEKDKGTTVTVTFPQ
jgi:two-component system sensor histidine kinase HydH